MSELYCPVCNNKLSNELTDWHRLCSKCFYECSDLKPSINTKSTHDMVHEEDRSIGLKSLRQSNFLAILKQMESLCLAEGSSILEVGCAHGWFLELANEKYTAVGIEPDRHIFEKTLTKGLKLRNGYFPDALGDNEVFDIIIFNDVLEHIPDTHKILEAVKNHLACKGFLIVNIPDSSGVFYRLSKILQKIKITSPFERLWQAGFPSPHLHYFNSGNLIQICEKHGFEAVAKHTLPSIHSQGLKERIGHINNQNPFVVSFMTLLLKPLLPFINLFPSDIVVIYFQQKGS